MKHKIIFVLVMLLLVGASMVLAFIDTDDVYYRYHQHKEVSTESQTELDFTDMDTHLPVIRIDTKGQKIPGTPIKGLEATYELSEQGLPTIQAGLTLYGDDKEPKEQPVILNYRGNSSRHFEKKSFSIRFIDEEEREQNVSLLGMERDNNWSLNGPYLDRSLIRNYIALNWAGEMMSFAPDVRFAEVFVNDEYEGLYLLMEKVSKGKGRVPIRSPENGSSKTSYILRYDRENKMEQVLHDFTMDTYKIFPSGTELRYPTEKLLTAERQQFVDRDYSTLTYAIYQIPQDDKLDYKQLLNVPEFYDYFIINELFRLEDTGQYSTYFYRDLRGKLTPVVWDFNNALNNYQDSEYNEKGFSMEYRIFYRELLKDRKFTEGLIRRYRSLRQTTLETERMLQYIDDTVDFLGPAIARNDARWGGYYDLKNYDSPNFLHPVERNMTSHKEAVKQVKHYLEKRAAWMDENIDTLKQYSHPSRIAHEAVK